MTSPWTPAMAETAAANSPAPFQQMVKLRAETIRQGILPPTAISGGTPKWVPWWPPCPWDPKHHSHGTPTGLQQLEVRASPAVTNQQDRAWPHAAAVLRWGYFQPFECYIPYQFLQVHARFLWCGPTPMQPRNCSANTARNGSPSISWCLCTRSSFIAMTPTPTCSAGDASKQPMAVTTWSIRVRGSIRPKIPRMPTLPPS